MGRGASSKVNEGPFFAQIDREVSERKDISSGAKLVYGWIWAHDGTPEGCFASAQRLGEECGLSEKQVRTHIDKLVALRLLDRQSRKGKTPILRAREIGHPGSRVPDTPEVEFRRKEKVKEKVKNDLDRPIENGFSPGPPSSSFWNASELEPLRGLMAKTLSREPSEQGPSKVMLQAEGSPVEFVVELLKTKIPASRRARTRPHSEQWFIEVVRKHFHDKRLIEQTANPLDARWRALLATYPNRSYIREATEAWHEIVENAPEPLREADRALDAARVIKSLRIKKEFQPSLARFIRGKRYLEDWRAAAKLYTLDDRGAAANR